jgi:hypothetical protein
VESALHLVLASLAGISNCRGRAVMHLDRAVSSDAVTGVEATDGTETIVLTTHAARVMVFP